MPNNVITTSALVPLGEVKASDRITPAGFVTAGAAGDSGWVDAEPGWSPSAQVNAHSSGVFSVPAKWAGMRPALIGSTVCRVGQTSGGPHCGQLADDNQTVPFPSGLHSGLNRVSGSCTLRGDSGGPWFSVGSNQIQGTNTGGSDLSSCSAPGWITYYTPITTHIANHNLTMYTTHGSASPTPVSLECPDYGSSGGGQFFCSTSYNSQGATTVSWVRGGSTFFSESLFGFCSPGTVYLTLKLSNKYGSTSQNISFPCPTGPIP
jgi:hypothetical protein